METSFAAEAFHFCLLGFVNLVNFTYEAFRFVGRGLRAVLSFFWNLIKNAVVTSFLMVGSIVYAIFQLFVFLLVIGLVGFIGCGIMNLLH